jgi:hypothetical protein
MVSIDTVYQRVLALANKEQRGYITPQEFNLFANQAQMDIFEQYFYDLNQFKRIPGNDTVHSDTTAILEEKISLFEVAIGSNATTGVASWGMNGNAVVIPDEVYRLSQVRVGGYPIEILPTKEFNMVRESPLTAPTAKRPIARRDFKGLTIKGGVPNNGFILPSTHDINASYIKKPTKVEWWSVNGLYNSTNSVDFELHDSEETDLVIKILGLAGITLKDPALYQIAGAEDNKNIQQEKQ